MAGSRAKRARFSVTVALLVGIAVTMVATISGSVSIPSARAATDSTPWQISAAPDRMDLSLSDSSLSSTLVDFPVKVVLTPSNFDYATASSDGKPADAKSSDLGFVMADDSTDTQLPYYVDSWNPGGTSVIYVQVPSLSGSSEDLELYYGADGVPAGTYDGASAASAVWGNGYTDVNEFQASTAQFPSGDSPMLSEPLPTAPASPSADPSAGGDGIPTGTVFPDLLGGTDAGATVGNSGATSGDYESTEVQGESGGQAVQLTGITGGTSSFGGQYMELPGSDADNSGQLTESFTVYIPQAALDAANNGMKSLPLGQQAGTPSGASGDLFFDLAGGKLNVYVYPGLTTGTGQQNTQSALPAAGWNTIAAVIDGTSLTTYLNGQKVGSLTAANALAEDPTAPIFLGEWAGPTANSSEPATAFAYQDVTFSDVARSSDWLQAEAASEGNNLISYGFGESEDGTAPPAGVSISGSGDQSSPTISWNPVAGVSGYDIYEGTSPGGESSTPIATVNGATSYQVTGLSGSQKYYFTVASITASGHSLPSSEVSYEFLSAPSPTATAYYSGTEVAISWPAITDATSYSVYEGTSSGGESSMPTDCSEITATRCLITGLTPGQTYYFTMTVGGNGLTSPSSQEVSATTPAQDTSGQQWQISAAPYRMDLSLSDSTLSSTLDDFPVKVVLTPSNFDYGGASADGKPADASSSDLAFVLAADSASTATQLPYQVNSWNPGGTSVIYVMVPTLSSNTEGLELYYGDDGVPAGTYDGPAAASAVWGNGYTNVNEFQASTAQFPNGDSPTLSDPLPTAPVNPSADPAAGGDGIPTGTVFPDVLGGASAGATVENNGATSGAYESTMVQGDSGGQAVQLSGVTDTSSFGGQYMLLPGSDADNDGQLTESFTIYIPQAAIDAANNSGTTVMVGQEAGNPAAGDSADLLFNLAGSALNVYVYPGLTTTDGKKNTQSALPVAGWNTFAAVIDGTSLTTYLNGQKVGSITVANALPDNPTSPISLGVYAEPFTNSNDPATAFAYQDITFSDVARNSDWMQAEAASEGNNLISYGFGESEDGTTPAGVAISAGGDQSLPTISWNPVAGISSYDIYESTTPGGESSTPIATVTSGTSYQVTGLSPSQKYYFTVASVTTSGTSLPSREVSYEYLPAPSPTATAYYSGTEAAISWPAITDATSYSVYEGTSSGGESSTPANCIEMTATRCLITGLTPGQTYYFTMTASGSGLASPTSQEVSATTPTQDTSGKQWQMSAAPYRMPLEATDTNIVASLNDFPAEVVLTPQNFDYAADSSTGSASGASSSDLAFVLADDSASTPTQLAYQVASWNPGGTSVLYVKLPLLPELGVVDLELYYGPAAAGTYTGPNGADTWSNGYTNVNEFTATTAQFPTGDAPTLTDPLPAAPAGPSADPSSGGDGIPTGTVFPDVLGGAGAGATVKNNGATSGNYESTEVQGEAGGQAVQLTGVTGGSSTYGGQYMQMPASDADNNGQLTESFTFYVPKAAIGTASALPLGQAPGDLFFDFSAGLLNVYVYPGQTTTAGQQNTQSALPAVGWNTLGAVIDGTSMTVYLNGQKAGTLTAKNALAKDPTEPIFLGENSGNPSSSWPADAFAYQDVTFSDVARTSNWMQAESQSAANQIFTYSSSQSPTTPLNAKASGDGSDGNATVSWQAPLQTSGVTGYEVFAGSTGGGESSNPVATVGPSATSTQVTGLPSGTTQLTVEAVTASGDSLPSNEAPYTWIAAPVGVGASDYSDSSVELNWSATAGASSYQVYEGTGAGAESSTPVNCRALTSTSCVVSGLTYGQKYYFTVTGSGDGLTSAASSEFTGEPGLQSPWVVSSARERLPILLNNVSSGETTTDQPVQVQLPASFDYANASPDHLEFTLGSDPTPLPYQVSDWDAGGVSTIWVQVPALESGGPSVYMYYNGVGTQTQATVSQSGPTPDVGSTEYDFSSTGAFIDGTPQIGRTLTADTSGFTPAADAYSYQWYDDGTPISGATGPTLTLTTSALSDGTIAIGDHITVQISGIDGDLTLDPTSQPDTVAAGQFTPGTPTISGPAQVGDTLNASAGKWSPSGTSAYQWLLNGSPINGATSSSYKVAAADAGGQVAVRVTESAAGFANASVTSAPVTIEPPTSGAGPGAGASPVIGNVTISGAVQVGQTVTASPGTWSPSAAPSYQWILNGVAINGATGASYTVAAGDYGKQLGVRVTEDPSAAGSESAASPTYEVEAGTFSAPTPSIGGGDATGDTLTAELGHWTPIPTTVAYQWLLNGKPIAGATGASFTVPVGDAGQQLAVIVNGSASGYQTVSVTAPAVTIAPVLSTKGKSPSPVKALAIRLASTVKPVIKGRATVGGRLSVSAGTWTIKPQKLTYQWYLNGRPVAGAHGRALKLTKRFAGKKVMVKVTAHRGKSKVTVTAARVEVKPASARRRALRGA